MEMSYYDASVVFFGYCVKRLKEDEILNKTKKGVFMRKGLSSMNSKKAKYLLNRAMEAHDLAFEKQGQLGRLHRCNNKPYTRNNSDSTENLPTSKPSPTHISNSGLWYFNASGFMDNSSPSSDVLAAKMFDKLCFGGQLKVGKRSINGFEN